MKVLFIEPPRRVWPYMNHEDNFLTKQAHLALAAALRVGGFRDVAILDCLPLRMGWKSLARQLSQIRPDVVAIGENHALYSDEAMKAFSLVRRIVPGAVTVAGGAHFTNLADAYLGAGGGVRSASAPPWLRPERGLIDYIVKGEGDVTIVDLVRHLAGGSGLPEEIPGLAFRDHGEVVHTAPRELVSDLDTLPLPAYDLVPMDKYGTSRLLFSPGGTTIQHSRGCAHACSFCVWWTQMARRVVDRDGKERLAPRWRTRSVAGSVEEVELLVHKYHRKALVFVDECWNLDPNWGSQFADEIIRRRIKVNWFAFMRADHIIRDHRSGVLEKLVNAGLSHVSVGAERVEDEKLAGFAKSSYSAEQTREAFALLKRHHPQVFRQATFIVGVPDETRESMLRQLEFARQLDLDYPGFHPLTPVPGTTLWEESIEAGIIEAENFTEFDWATPVIRSATMSRREIEETLIEMEKRYVRPSWLLKGLVSPYRYKRAMYQWFAKVSASMALGIARNTLFPSSGALVPLEKPVWYDG